MKKCFKCGEVKCLSFFYKHKKMADGHVNKCKECNKKDVRENRKQNIEYYRDYDRKRGCRQDKHDLKEWRESNPKKYYCHRAVYGAIKNGILLRPDKCELCETRSSLIRGHHCDYNKPIDVMWLCPACHRNWHDENGEGLNAH